MKEVPHVVSHGTGQRCCKRQGHGEEQERRKRIRRADEEDRERACDGCADGGGPVAARDPVVESNGEAEGDDDQIENCGPAPLRHESKSER